MDPKAKGRCSRLQPDDSIPMSSACSSIKLRETHLWVCDCACLSQSRLHGWYVKLQLAERLTANAIFDLCPGKYNVWPARGSWHHAIACQTWYPKLARSPPQAESNATCDLNTCGAGIAVDCPATLRRLFCSAIPPNVAPRALPSHLQRPAEPAGAACRVQTTTGATNQRAGFHCSLDPSRTPRLG